MTISRRGALAAALGTGLAATIAGTSTAAVSGSLEVGSSPRVLLIGDSYTQGVGAVPMTNGYAYKIATPLGWRLTVNGRGGSGYANPTNYGKNLFADRLYDYEGQDFDLIILQGSSNDVKYLSVLAGRINATIDTARKLFPRARILLVGPCTPYGSPGSELTAVRDKVKAASRAYGLPFVDGLRWFWPGDGAMMANPDNGHPSNAGHATIAHLLVDSIRRLQGQ